MENKFNLPDYCFAEDGVNPGNIIIIKYGVSGYYPTGKNGNAMDYNEKIGVTWAQMQAMIAGSMFGWDVPGVDPKFYEDLSNKSK